MKNKIKIYMLALAAFVSLGSMAQVQVALGLKAGANLSKFDDPDTKNLTSFHVGAFGLFKLTKIGIQPEVLFSQQGATIKDVNLNNIDLKTSYVNIPVMLKLYLVAGIGFLTAAKLDKTDIKSSLKSSDISANFGLGWDLPFGLMLDARYNLGLSDISDVPTNLDALKSRVIQISLGYKFIKIGK
jgi:Outer membrane protein beta-barrel domain